MLEKCKNSEHTLETITALAHWDGSSQVVRWCSVCGSIVIDTQVDKRVFPGQIMPMKFPEIFKKEFNDTSGGK